LEIKTLKGIKSKNLKVTEQLPFFIYSN
jgi:hypothetical protein